MTLGERIAYYRGKLGLSQGELAEQLGVSRQAVSKWETDAGLPDLERLIALSRLYHITLDELVKGESPEETAEAPEEIPVDAVIAKPAAPSGQKTIGYILLGVGLLCAVLALCFAASFAFRHPRPRLCLFFSLMGIVLNLEALANGQSLFFTALTAAAVLVLLAQSWALLRTCFGPAWPECLLEDRMPSGALERAEGDNAPGGAGVENHHREDD